VGLVFPFSVFALCVKRLTVLRGPRMGGWGSACHLGSSRLPAGHPCEVCTDDCDQAVTRSLPAPSRAAKESGTGITVLAWTQAIQLREIKIELLWFQPERSRGHASCWEASETEAGFIDLRWEGRCPGQEGVTQSHLYGHLQAPDHGGGHCFSSAHWHWALVQALETVCFPSCVQ
jgi:hypothetical protein